jgi:hypothetical protein
MPQRVWSFMQAYKGHVGRRKQRGGWERGVTDKCCFCLGHVHVVGLPNWPCLPCRDDTKRVA